MHHLLFPADCENFCHQYLRSPRNLQDAIYSIYFMPVGKTLTAYTQILLNRVEGLFHVY